ncbi:hypothetical protein BRADI_1g17764v3 [Brachypodium distachyon]|uniref:Uncharacterized protein n=1 Tax=Brachypodium distachyon TaxID=15368 RepID=A0A2K2DJW1_BRADI|nr:hypothetical protein BRADI_1g17764v3 [Brachypodium distachyon]
METSINHVILSRLHPIPRKPPSLQPISTAAITPHPQKSSNLPSSSREAIARAANCQKKHRTPSYQSCRFYFQTVDYLQSCHVHQKTSPELLRLPPESLVYCLLSQDPEQCRSPLFPPGVDDLATSIN